MMKVQSIIEQATTEGVVITLSENGKIKVAGGKDVVDRWRPLLQERKQEIVDHLVCGGGAVRATWATVPSWCSARCEHFHELVVPDLGTMMMCCWEADLTHWRRLRIDTMNSCPMEVQP